MYTFTDSCNRTQNVTVKRSDDVFWVEIVGLPVLVLICTIGNVLNIIVMTCERPQQNVNAYMVSRSTKVFLLAMAFSDVFLLWVQTPRYWAEYVQNVAYTDYSSVGLGFKNFYGAQQWWSDASITFSDWVLIAFSIDRLRSFHYFAKSFEYKAAPAVLSTGRNGPKARQTISLVAYLSRDAPSHETPDVLRQISSEARNVGRIGRKTAIQVVVFLLLGALIFTMENGVYYFYWSTQDPGNGTPYYVFRPDWLTSWHFYHNILDVAMTVAKFLALLLINIHLIIILVRQRDSDSGKDDTAKTPLRIHYSGGQSKERTGTHLLIGCLIVYFFTHFPYVVYQCIRLVTGAPYCLYFLNMDTAMVARPLLRILLFFNYSVNFLLYYALSKRFRDQLKLLPARVRAWRDRISLTCSVGAALRKLSPIAKFGNRDKPLENPARIRFFTVSKTCSNRSIDSNDTTNTIID